MHEMGIVFHVMDMVEDVAEENELSKVTSVTLQLGEVSGVIFSYMADLWEWCAAKRPLFAGSVLKSEEIHAVTICNACGKTYDTVPQGRICPYCGSEDTVLVTGNEVLIKEVEGM